MIDVNQYRWLRLEPIDAWFFRDGRPSNRGEDQSDLESDFPPNCATVVGSLRAALAREKGWRGNGSWAEDANLKDVLGDGFDDHYLGRLSFLGPLLMEGDEILWPMPRHILGRTTEIEDDEGRSQIRFEATMRLAPSPSSVPCDAGSIRLPWLPKDPLSQPSQAGQDKDGPDNGDKPTVPAEGAFVTTAGMSKILAGELPAVEECRLQDGLFKVESRIGIQRDDTTRTTGPNAMYSPRYVRLLRGISLAVGVAGLPEDWYLPPLVALGGESRMAGVDVLLRAPDFPRGSTAGDSFRLAVSITPARFFDPWWCAGPGDDAAKLSTALSGKIATVALDRPQRIGGWNSIDGRPLPLRPFIPPGTVWWIESGETAEVQQLQVGESIVYGYGLILVSGYE